MEICFEHQQRGNARRNERKLEIYFRVIHSFEICFPLQKKTREGNELIDERQFALYADTKKPNKVRHRIMPLFNQIK